MTFGLPFASLTSNRKGSPSRTAGTRNANGAANAAPAARRPMRDGKAQTGERKRREATRGAWNRERALYLNFSNNRTRTARRHVTRPTRTPDPRQTRRSDRTSVPSGLDSRLTISRHVTSRLRHRWLDSPRGTLTPDRTGPSRGPSERKRRGAGEPSGAGLTHTAPARDETRAPANQAISCRRGCSRCQTQRRRTLSRPECG